MRNHVRRLFRGSRINRDRREDSFARAVIATAESQRRVQEAREAVDDSREEKERCIWCPNEIPKDGMHWPYCSLSCSLAAEVDSRD